MLTADEPRLDLAQLARALEAVDPSVLLVPGRLLRRVIKQHRGLSTLGLQVPHPKSYVVDRQALLQIADVQELEIEPERSLPETLILLARPEPAQLAQLTAGEALVKFWRRLFHARVHLALEQRFKEGQVTEAGIRQRIQRIGPPEFNEVRSVLEQENYLLPPADDRGTFIEFAAVYLELRFFARALLPRYFPSLTRLEEIDALLSEDVDGAALFAGTRPAGAPEPHELSEGRLQDVEEDADAPPGPLPAAEPSAPLTADDYEALLARAEQAKERGNTVRAAVLLARAAKKRPEIADRCRRELGKLVDRLGPALCLSGPVASAWRQALSALLPGAAEGFWSVERRLLYDLQKVCLDHERGVYTVDVVEWLRSFGQRPLRRPLPALAEVRTVKRLRKAMGRLRRARLAEEDRARLIALLEAALTSAEARLRARCRPPLTAILEQVRLTPTNVPEEVARDKLIEELLDRVVAGGYLTMGDLRDAISRNQLKLEDLGDGEARSSAVATGGWQRLAGWFRAAGRAGAEFLHGDPLLRLNRRLALVLDGVYHRGEFYLRGLQRFSSLAFGTAPGRFLTRYLVVPFGGAFVLLKGTDEVLELVFKAHLHLATVGKVGLLGLFFLLLIYVAPFRRALGQGLVLAGRGLRRLLLDLPAWVLRLRPVRLILDSRPVAFVRRYLLLPLILALTAGEGSALLGLDVASAAVLGGSAFVVALVFCASRVGRDLSEALSDWLARAWRRLSIDIVPALFHAIMEFYKALLELVSRFLYTIDEWLHFRSGEGWFKQALKAIAGGVWFVITYLVRFAINVLIEPQINPIKHFPVVTVSHKLVLSLMAVLAHPYADAMGWEGREGYLKAFGILATVGTMIPGMFGFIAWELRENWKLYKANRPQTLRPVVIGNHGETMPRLLRRGFHSGTVPKLHARLRKAEYRGQYAKVRKHLAALHHIAEAIRHFVERELISLLGKSNSWAGLPLEVGEVVLASNRIRVELRCPPLPGGPVAVVFDEQQGWLLAGLGETGWLGELAPGQRRALAAALTGLYKMAAVMLVREQIQASLAPACCGYDLTRDALVVWPDPHYEAEVVYELRAGPVLRPRPTLGVPSVTLPTLPAAKLLFEEAPLTWTEWVALWQRDRAGEGLPEQLLPGIRVLPPDKASGPCF
jgi:hypothetical protein